MINLQTSSSTAAAAAATNPIIKGSIISKEVLSSTSPSPSSTTTDDILEEEDYLVGQFPEGLGSSAPLIIVSSRSSRDDDQTMMKKESREIIEEKEEEKDDDEVEATIATARNYYFGRNNNHNLYATTNANIANDSTSNTKQRLSSTEEIVEVGDQEIQGERSSLFSFDLSSSFHHHQDGGDGGCDGDGDGDGDGDAVYVVVSSSSTSASMDALEWALNQPSLINPSSTTTVSLVHVFPQIKHIPTPLGMMAVSQVNPEQKEKYMAEERGKRMEFLNKFINACSTAKVKMDTVLIESETEAQAVLDLIPILNVTKLVLGTTKANLRKMRSKKASGSIADQIVRAAPECCEVKIICEGKEVHDPFADAPSPRAYKYTPRPSAQNQAHEVSFGCGGWFKTKFLS